MFILNLHYSKPLSEVDAYLDAHRNYLKHYFDEGLFIAAGRKIPATGGVILLHADSRQQVEAVLKEDPFYQAGVAEYELIEFTPGRVGNGFEALAGM